MEEKCWTGVAIKCKFIRLVGREITRAKLLQAKRATQMWRGGGGGGGGGGSQSTLERILGGMVFSIHGNYHVQFDNGKTP